MTPRRSGRAPKVKLGISLDAEIYAALLRRTGPGQEFSSVSHGIERALFLHLKPEGAIHLLPAPPTSDGSGRKRRESPPA